MKLPSGNVHCVCICDVLWQAPRAIRHNEKNSAVFSAMESTLLFADMVTRVRLGSNAPILLHEGVSFCTFEERAVQPGNRDLHRCATRPTWGALNCLNTEESCSTEFALVSLSQQAKLLRMIEFSELVHLRWSLRAYLSPRDLRNQRRSSTGLRVAGQSREDLVFSPQHR